MTARKSLAMVSLVVASLALGLLPAATGAQVGGDAMEIEATITADGEFETVAMVWKTDAETYEALLATAQREGYETVATWFAEEQLLPEENGYEGYGHADDRELENGYAIEVEFDEFDHETFEDLTLTADDGTVSFELTEVDDPAEDPMFDEITYVVEMPGEITESNAHETDDGTAVWHLHEESPEVLTVQAETDGGDDGLPGFGIGAAAVGVLAVVAVLRRRSN